MQIWCKSLIQLSYHFCFKLTIWQLLKYKSSVIMKITKKNHLKTLQLSVRKELNMMRADLFNETILFLKDYQ